VFAERPRRPQTIVIEGSRPPMCQWMNGMGSCIWFWGNGYEAGNRSRGSDFVTAVNYGFGRADEPRGCGGSVGETATVCGVVASAKFAASSRSQPTFLDMVKPYPNSAFTVVILWGDRPKFETPESSLRGKRVCVTGQIHDYRGKPEIVLSDPSQLAH
jgi:hypothetical protein